MKSDEKVSQREKLIFNDSINEGESQGSMTSSVGEAYGYIPLSSISTDTSMSGETKVVQGGARLTLPVFQPQPNNEGVSHGMRATTVSAAVKEEVTRSHYPCDGMAQPRGSVGGACCIVDGGKMRGDNFSSATHAPQVLHQRQCHTGQTARRMLLLAGGEDSSICANARGGRETEEDRDVLSESGLASSLPHLGGGGGAVTEAAAFSAEAH